MKVKISVLDMHCVNCAMTLQSLEDDLEGVRTVDASYQRQSMQVDFDETVVNIETILQAVRNLGYTPKLD